MHITARDRRLLTWIGEQFILNRRELDVLLQLDAAQHNLKRLGEYVGRDLVARWKRGGLVDSVHQLQRGSHIFLTGKGIHTAGLPYSGRTPGRMHVAHLSHHDGVNRVRLGLEQWAWQQAVELQWVSERALLQQASTLPPNQRPHRPDGVVHYADMCIAIEVERAYKRPVTRKKILQGYLYQTQYTHVHYYCDSSALQRSLARTLHTCLTDLPLIEQSQLKERIHILPLPGYDD